MPKFSTDLTKVDMIEGDLIAVVKKVEYQQKTGDKWNNEGTTTVDKATWENVEDSKARIRLSLYVEGKGFIFTELYFSERAMPMTKRALAQCGVNFTTSGYDPDEAVGKSVGISVVITQTAGYDPKSEIKKWTKV